MNTALALEIYRDSWALDYNSLQSFQNLLSELRKGMVLEAKEKKNSFCLADLVRGSTISADSADNTTKSENLISVTTINGVITKEGGNSTYGMKDLSASLLSADADPNVIGHLFVIDSPGGSISGMNYMQQTMAQLTKPKVAMVERSGIAASGGYGIASHADYLYAEHADSEVGSIGVISGTSGVPNGKKDGNGEVNYMVYASTAPKKNEAERAAIENGDITLLQKRATQLHQVFKDSTVSKRKNIGNHQMTGDMYKASDVLGSMVDAIGSKSDAINKILELSKSNNTFIPNIKNNQTKAMTAAEFKAAHPTAYAEIFDAGVNAEQDRVGAWMAYSEADPEAVQKGIESGKAISQKESHQFLVKMQSASTLKALQGDSATKIVTPPAAKTETVLTEAQKADEKEKESLYGKYLKPTN